VFTQTRPPPPPGATVAPGLAIELALGFGVAFFGVGEAEGIGLGVLLRPNHERAVGEGDAAGVTLAAAIAFLRVRCSGVAEPEGMGEAAGLASVASFFRVRCDVAEGEAAAVASLGLASAVAWVFLWPRCFAGDSEGEGLGVSLCANEAPAKATMQRTTRYFKIMAQSREATR
jgi:hypothetical protein